MSDGVLQCIQSNDELGAVELFRSSKLDQDTVRRVFDAATSKHMAVLAHLSLEAGVAPTIDRLKHALSSKSEPIAMQLWWRSERNLNTRRRYVRLAIEMNMAQVAANIFEMHSGLYQVVCLFESDEIDALLRDPTVQNHDNLRYCIESEKKRHRYSAERTSLLEWAEGREMPEGLVGRFRTCLLDADVVAMEQLLADGLDANASRDGASLLMRAVESESAEIVAALLRAGADPNLHAWYCLPFAAERRNYEVVRELLDGGADVNAQDWDGNTALHHSARPHNDAGVCLLLLTRGAKPNLRNARGATALNKASRVHEALIRDHGGKRAHELDGE
ncbi:MAG: ankyrin repeat domain-containing protein [Polyangiales bacterium]